MCLLVGVLACVRACLWVCVCVCVCLCAIECVCARVVLLSSRVERGQNTHTHNTHTQTHTGTGVCDKDWIDYLSIFAVKNEVSVAKIESII